MTRSRPSRRLLVRALLAVLLLGLGACGLSEDSRPKVIAADDIPEQLIDPTPSSSTSVVQAPNAQVTVYYVALQDGMPHLRPVTRLVADPTSPAARLNALLSPPTPEEQAGGISTSIPADTRLLGTRIDPGEPILTIDLSGAVFDVQGEELRNAFAQLVWTATELDSVRRVRFEVDGEEYRVPDDAGIEQTATVGRADYEALRPL